MDLVLVFIIKIVIRGFLVTFVHIQALEKHLNMLSTAAVLQEEIELYQSYLAEQK